MQVLAFPAIRTAAAGEEEAAVFDTGGVGPGEACVLFDAAARLGLGFAEGKGNVSYVCVLLWCSEAYFE